ncbi:hypothetical protein QQM79_01180 [Marinobacteraceae bacterium S3BR75-40.1]
MLKDYERTEERGNKGMAAAAGKQMGRDKEKHLWLKIRYCRPRSTVYTELQLQSKSSYARHFDPALPVLVLIVISKGNTLSTTRLHGGIRL